MKNKRFIAGAICPKCGCVDKVFTYQQDGARYRACTRCDFNEEMRFVPHPSELPTRVTGEDRLASTPAQVIQFRTPKST